MNAFQEVAEVYKEMIIRVMNKLETIQRGCGGKSSMTNTHQYIASIFGAVVIAMAAFPMPVSADATTPFTYSGADRQQALVEGAKKEGQVLLYSGWVTDQVLKPMVEAFHKKYPFIDSQYVRVSDAALFQKVTSESRAGAHFADVVSTTGIAGPMIEAGLCQAFDSPSADSFPSEYKSPDDLFVSPNVYYYGVAYNTNHVKPSEVPQTNEDLLDPKWRGKIVWPFASNSGAPMFIENILMTMGDENGEAYLKKLSTNKIVNYSGSARAMVDQVGQGEYALALQSFAHHPILSQALGAPLDVTMLEPVPVDTATMMAVKGAPHPHAAMLLIDFILSHEGQTILRDAGYFPARPDVEHVPAMRKVIPQLNNKKANIFSADAVFKVRDKADAIMERYFK